MGANARQIVTLGLEIGAAGSKLDKVGNIIGLDTMDARRLHKEETGNLSCKGLRRAKPSQNVADAAWSIARAVKIVG